MVNTTRNKEPNLTQVSTSDARWLVSEVLRATAGYSDSRALYFFTHANNDDAIVARVEANLKTIGLEGFFTINRMSGITDEGHAQIVTSRRAAAASLTGDAKTAAEDIITKIIMAREESQAPRGYTYIVELKRHAEKKIDVSSAHHLMHNPQIASGIRF